ncbi:FAD-linked oxidase C-terminal domain-containing protein [Streptomyces sp. NPDC097727]|uniref:FAD-linked oxidase C-terminal domain-containing protein n=1 Tax=Streptomyces sp. NPDC097727 TaxID=3366092 RepID=UPI003830338C
MRLRPARPQERTVAGYFSSVVAAGEAVSAVTASGVVPSALELVDRHCLAAVDAWKKMGLSADSDVVLLGRVDTRGAEGDAEAELVRD